MHVHSHVYARSACSVDHCGMRGYTHVYAHIHTHVYTHVDTLPLGFGVFVTDATRRVAAWYWKRTPPI